MENARTTVGKATDKFLRSLRERNVSPHTIKAYSGDLVNFSLYIGSRKWREINHATIHGFLSHLYEKGLGKTSVAPVLAPFPSLHRWPGPDEGVDQYPTPVVVTPTLPK